MRLNKKPLTPSKIGVILLLVQFLAPQTISYFYSDFNDRFGISLIGFLWAFYYSSEEGIRLSFATVSGLVYSFLFLGLGFIFVYQVVQYCKEKAGRTSTIVAGIASLCPVLFLRTIPDLLSGWPVLYCPLPILLVLGLTAMRYAGPKEPTTPWDEQSNLQIDSP